MQKFWVRIRLEIAGTITDWHVITVSVPQAAAVRAVTLAILPSGWAIDEIADHQIFAY